MTENFTEYAMGEACESRPELAAKSDGPCQESSCAELVAIRRPALSLAERVRAYEVGLIREALAQTRGNQSEAARLLGVPRRTLAHKVLTYGLAESRRATRRKAPLEPAD